MPFDLKGSPQKVHKGSATEGFSVPLDLSLWEALGMRRDDKRALSTCSVWRTHFDYKINIDLIMQRDHCNVTTIAPASLVLCLIRKLATLNHCCS